MVQRLLPRVALGSQPRERLHRRGLVQEPRGAERPHRVVEPLLRLVALLGEPSCPLASARAAFHTSEPLLDVLPNPAFRDLRADRDVTITVVLRRAPVNGVVALPR